MEIKDLKEILKLLTDKENESYLFYSEISNKVLYPHVKALLTEVASEELKHKESLEDLMNDLEKLKDFMSEENEKIEEPLDLKLTDHLTAKLKLEENATLQEALLFAIKHETESYNFYRSLYNFSKDERAAKLFHYLAAQELSHKARLEKIYDEIIYKEF